LGCDRRRQFRTKAISRARTFSPSSATNAPSRDNSA
jgi:hypothetical protein